MWKNDTIYNTSLFAEEKQIFLICSSRYGMENLNESKHLVDPSADGNKIHWI
jgi:hypothetical protein